ncbi:pseudouridine synthase [bacterium (Candidatus Howlettbacteria) CG_4_10_14_0_8_um_filter_40_9]|nr:MAG: pseudouridine synthase [bacterium (Candidatus Howlettbacteria) CG_4_10_14_0_8_um_filter_40_9]
MLIRLSKFLSNAGISSRRKAEEIILEGRVCVNEKVVIELGTKIDPEKDKVTVDQVLIRANTKKVYYLLNKPAGYTSTSEDPHAKHTVLELVPSDIRVFPVGRLDKDTMGLLILTNDGELTQKLTHPRYEKEKEYIVICGSKLTDIEIKKLEIGIMLDDKKTAPTKVRFITGLPDKYFHYSVTIREGRNRQIRRMFESIRNPVIKLERVRIDSLSLGDLKEGKYREITKQEIDKLYGKRN